MKNFLIVLLTFLITVAGLFGYSYATKGDAKDLVDSWFNTNVEQPEEPEEPEEPGDVVAPEDPNEPEEHVHAYKTVLSFDDTYHFYVCEDETCNEVKDKAEHVYTWVIDTPASTFSAGVKHEECECGIKRNENTAIEELGLTSVLNVRDTELTFTNAETSSEMQYYGIGTWENSEEFYTMIYNLDFTLDDSDVNFFTFGTTFRLGGDIRLLVRYSATSAAQASFDFFFGGTRYRLINEDVTNLVLDVLENQTLSLEVGSTKYNDVVYFGFKFTSQNYELCFTSLNDGNLTKETELFLSAGSNSTSGDNYTLYNLISSYEEKCVSGAIGPGLTSVVYVSYADSEASTALNVDNTSAWFNNVVKKVTENGHNYVDDNEFVE